MDGGQGSAAFTRRGARCGALPLSAGPRTRTVRQRSDGCAPGRRAGLRDAQGHDLAAAPRPAPPGVPDQARDSTHPPCTALTTCQSVADRRRSIRMDVALNNHVSRTVSGSAARTRASASTVPATPTRPNCVFCQDGTAVPFPTRPVRRKSPPIFGWASSHIHLRRQPTNTPLKPTNAVRSLISANIMVVRLQLRAAARTAGDDHVVVAVDVAVDVHVGHRHPQPATRVGEGRGERGARQRVQWGGAFKVEHVHLPGPRNRRGDHHLVPVAAEQVTGVDPTGVTGGEQETGDLPRRGAERGQSAGSTHTSCQ